MLSEILLDVVSFFDYATLVLFRLTNKQSIRFVDRYADQLAFRRTFTVYSRTGQALGSQLFLEEIRADNSRMPLHLDATDDERLSGAIYVLHLLIDPHAVVEVDLEQFPLSVKPFVEHVPALRHASEVYLDYDGISPPPLQEYKEIVSLFIRPNRVCFPKIPVAALVAFLESACAAQLEDWSVCAPRADECDELEGLEVSQENIICRSFFDFTNLEQGERKDFTFTGWNLRWDFLRRIIEVVNTIT
ncbi:hypothetical protein AAVH_20258 [Aphelenchoides avenae]|nr:hypothetical protein AAVH_20258 [Aphelenchus avenae]